MAEIKSPLMMVVLLQTAWMLTAVLQGEGGEEEEEEGAWLRDWS